MLKIKQSCRTNDIFYLKYPFEFPKECIDEVLQVYEEGFFVKHRGSDSHGWQSCALHGWGVGKPEYYRTMNPSGYGIKEEDVVYGWTEIEELAPRTKQFLQDNFDTSVMRRARFMLLEPGGYIKEHTDGEERNIMSAINGCLTQPKDCYLRRTDTLEEVPFEPLKLFWYDNRVMHEAKNNSNENRFHFIIHGYYTDITKKHLIEAYKKEHGDIY